MTQDQKAERAVVHALGSGWSPVGRGSFPDRRGHAGAPEGLSYRIPRDQQAESSYSAFAEVNTG